MKYVIQKWRELKLGPYRFLIDIGFFMIITYGFHWFWWENATWIKSHKIIYELADGLANLVYRAAYRVNEVVFGLEMQQLPLNTIRFENQKALQVAESCSGLKQFFQIAVLFILFPGSWKHKIWFIPTGFIAIHLVNIFRVSFLSVWMAWDIQFWDFAHDWIMRPFYYVVIFVLWYLWNEYFNVPNSKVKSPHSAGVNDK